MTDYQVEIICLIVKSQTNSRFTCRLKHHWK